MTAIQGFTDRAEWLAARRQGIGASESATILGLNPWQTQAELYLRKLGELPEQEETWPMRLGSYMEGLLQSEYEARHGCQLQTQVWAKHPEHPWLFATLDGLAPDGTVVEFKTANWRSSREWGEPDTDDIPTHYLVQVQHQLEVTRLEKAHVFASIDRGEPVRFTVHRNPDIGEKIVAIAGVFWQHVCNRVPPRELLQPGDHKVMHLLYPEAAGAVSLGVEAEMMVNRRAELRGERMALDEEDSRLRTALLAELGPFESGSLPDGRIVTRKIVHVGPSTVERKAYSFTDLRVKKARS